MLNVGLVDEEWYLAHYPDVAGVVGVGQFHSGEHHYVAWGILEWRFPRKPEFDEDWYLDAYPDVATAVRNGRFGSGYEHYVHQGYAEGRKSRRDG